VSFIFYLAHIPKLSNMARLSGGTEHYANNRRLVNNSGA